MLSLPNVSTSEGLPEHDVPREVLLLAQALSRIHGDVIIRREEHGLHLYMASPTALERDGLKELQSRHLTVNAERYLGLGQWRNRQGTYNRESSAVCHKYGTKFTLDQLKSYPPLEKRGIKDVSHRVFDSAVAREEYLVDDGKGNKIPLHPGLVMPIQDLPRDHPAVEYLLGRNYDLHTLANQFRCGFCYSQTPENSEIKLFYKRLPGGFRDTPQGRLIFYADVKGIQQGWQARILEKVEGDFRYYWHPYNNQWELVFIRVGDTWQLRPDWQRDTYPWKPSKYKTGNGVQRRKLVMGYDAALDWNIQTGNSDNPFAILVEGPLDAGRFGPPGIAFLGKYLNEDQGDLLARGFRKVIFVADNDAAGREAKRSVVRALAGKVEFCEAVLPKGIKDAGELTAEEAWSLIKPFL